MRGMTRERNNAMTTAAANVQQEVQQQAGKLLGHIAGYVGLKTIQIGLANGLFATLARNSSGLIPAELASAAGVDEFYAGVWARGAFAAELLNVDADGRYTMVPHLDKLIVNEDFPTYLGGIPIVFNHPEIFENFSANLKSGKRIWWNETSPGFIQAVSGTGRPFYNRLIPAGLDKVEGLTAKLQAGANVLELATGAGRGLVKLAEAYPNVKITGVDGDAHSVGLANERLKAAGHSKRVRMVTSPLEDFNADSEFDLAVINISMHECRDIDKVTTNVKKALKPGGCFVISDFPFPDTPEGMRSLPGRVLSGIQYFEAQIDAQLMPTSAFVALLNKHGFKDVKGLDITPVHNLICGTK
jgi:ubiquinone/menaquinone biosynthesis C-methylase UbiE